jgi:2-keto-3-deoxy-L-fuconate dehydrogenase
MPGRLTGKTVFVTAAAAGIGRASALACAREGAAVIATDVSEAGLAALREEAPAGLGTEHLDVTDPAACARVPGRWPAIDALINVAGVVHHGTLLDSTPAEWERAWTLNVLSMIRLAAAVLPGMLARRHGSIVNVSSVVSSVKGAPHRCVYGTTKAAVVGLTKSIAADYVTHGIRCNAICPGTVDSPSLAGRLAATGDAEAARRAFVARQPMQRLGTPDEIAALVVYLASDEASFTTGAIHVIDGGWTA